MKIRGTLAAAIAWTIVLIPFAFIPLAHAATVLSVGVAYDTGGPGDHSFDDAVAQGLASAHKRFKIHITATVTIGSEADRELRIRSLVAKGCNPVIAVGSGYASALKKVALDFPSIQFVSVNDASIGRLNVTSLVFSENQGGYLAGVTAALATRSGKIGIVGTAKSAYEKGFTAGARATKKDIKIEARYGVDSSAFLTSGLISLGTDVVFLTTMGSDSDVLNTVVRASAGGAKVGLILIEPDQYVTLSAGAKKYILASLVKRVDRAIVDVIAESSLRHTVIDVLDPQLGIYGRRYGIHNGGIELSLWSPLVAKYRNVINLAAVKASKLPLL
jgi:basic membrane protein A